MIITSLQNPKVKEAKKLFDRRDRDRTQLFLIEGYRELLRAVEGGQPIDHLFICPALFLGENEGALIAKVAQVIEVNEAVFRKLSYRDRPDGLLAVAPQVHRGLEDIELTDHPFFGVVAEAIEKPGNLGTMLRSADAVGLDAFILADRTTDIHNPNVVRASTGTLFTTPLFEAESKETLAWCQERGIQVLAATPSAEKLYTEVDLTGPVCIAVGSEQLGLSDLWMESSDIQVRIPMLRKADSLNVATATTLLMYEVVRQRG